MTKDLYLFLLLQCPLLGHDMQVTAFSSNPRFSNTTTTGSRHLGVTKHFHFEIII
jgi:hypothetical protein